MEEKNNYMADLKEDMNKLMTDFAVMNNNLERQGAVIEKLTQSFDKLSVFIEKTNENNKKIDYLFKKVEEVYLNGTKACPLNISKIKQLERRIDKLNGYLIGLLIGVVLQFLALIVYFIEKHVI